MKTAHKMSCDLLFFPLFLFCIVDKLFGEGKPLKMLCPDTSVCGWIWSSVSNPVPLYRAQHPSSAAVPSSWTWDSLGSNCGPPLPTAPLPPATWATLDPRGLTLEVIVRL